MSCASRTIDHNRSCMLSSAIQSRTLTDIRKEIIVSVVLGHPALVVRLDSIPTCLITDSALLMIGKTKRYPDEYDLVIIRGSVLRDFLVQIGNARFARTLSRPDLLADVHLWTVSRLDHCRTLERLSKETAPLQAEAHGDDSLESSFKRMSIFNSPPGLAMSGLFNAKRCDAACCAFANPKGFTVAQLKVPYFLSVRGAI
jgi:hypothetical protein